MGGRVSDDPRVFVSTLAPGRDETRLALAIVLASAAVFLAVAPFAKVPLPRSPIFVLCYDLAITTVDLITAVLLFNQYRILRSRSVFVLACGYVFTAFLAVPHALTFPGLFSPTGLLGAGPQSTAWLYMFWHAGFPLFVIAYALLKDGDRGAKWPQGEPLFPVLLSISALLAVLIGLTLLATAGRDALPVIMIGNHYSPAMLYTVTSTWGFSLLALIVLWWRRPHTVLDQWLMVVMFAWIIDIALAAVLNAGRFDLGFYAGRAYGLAAVSIVLVVLSIQNSWLDARLARARAEEVRARLEALRSPGS